MSHNNSQYHNRRNSEASQSSREAASSNRNYYSQAEDRYYPGSRSYNSGKSYQSNHYGNDSRPAYSHSNNKSSNNRYSDDSYSRNTNANGHSNTGNSRLSDSSSNSNGYSNISNSRSSSDNRYSGYNDSRSSSRSNSYAVTTSSGSRRDLGAPSRERVYEDPQNYSNRNRRNVPDRSDYDSERRNHDKSYAYESSSNRHGYERDSRDYDSGYSVSNSRRYDYNRNNSRRNDYERIDGRSGNYAVSNNRGYGNNNVYRDDGYHDSGRNSRYRISNEQKPKKSHFKRNLILIIIAIVVIFGVAALISVNTLKDTADNLKAEIKTAISLVKEMDADGLAESIDSINEISDEMRDELKSPVWSVISAVPVYGKDVDKARELLDIIDEVTDKLLTPLVDEIESNPLSNMKVGDGFDVDLIASYFDLYDEVLPEIESIYERMSSISLKVKPGLVEEYTETLGSALELVDTLEPYIDLLKVMLVTNEDRLYLLVAQNSAEIRASDGFPGSVGLVRIQDGVLTIGDFRSVYDVFESDIMCTYEVTAQEVRLFSDQFAAWAHDACYNPDFGRVGEIWCQSYEQKNEEEIDGIISLTPAIIQELLAACNESVTLSDGTVLDGTNASKVLQHDIYYTYLRDAETAVYGNDIADELFAETAAKVMSIATSNLGTDTLKSYINILMNGAADRTVLIWMKDEDEEDVVYECGYSGKLNSDANNPVAGIYLNFADPCKLGWFLDIDTSLSEPTTKSDGRLEYTVTVKFTNTISGDDLDAYEYIIGSYGGSMFTYIYFFAPLDGIIYDFDSSYGMYIIEDEYRDLALGYRQDVVIDPGETITVTYKVITKKGVTTPLRLENTPTLQKYRYNQTNNQKTTSN